MKRHSTTRLKPLTDPAGDLRDYTDEFSFILRPSEHDGVGVFCTHGIRKDTRLRLFPGPRARLFTPEQLASCPLSELFCYRYGTEYPEGCYVPHDFGCMEIGWYLNHADAPNACRNTEYEYFANRDILAGEEITIDYHSL